MTLFVGSACSYGPGCGVCRLLLGIPTVMAISAVCERVEDLQAISEFPGYAPSKQRGEVRSGAPAA